MLVASAVLPMPGRPATMIRSDGCRPPILLSRSLRPVASPESPPSRGRGRPRLVAGGGGRGLEFQKPTAIPADLRQLIQAALGILDLIARREIDRRVEGDVDHVLADVDQLAPD